MAQNILTAKAVETSKLSEKDGKPIPKLIADGGGLYLRTAPAGDGVSRSWVFKFKLAGKMREMGIGAYPVVTLAEARERAVALRKQVEQGIDPIEQRKASQAAAQQPEKRVVTFGDAAKAFIDGKAAGWSNPKHVDQWRNTLATYCATFASKNVSDVTKADVEAALRPIWLTKSETATRVLTRVVAVMKSARRRGWSDTDASAWSEDIRADLPMLASKTERVQHHPALPYDQTPAFVASLKASRSMGSKALLFAILTAARSGEVRGARWSEIDLEQSVWTIPAARMKMKRAHSVPLSAPAIELLRSLPAGEPTDLVFPGEKQGQPVSDMTMTAVIRRANENELVWADASGEPVTAHGFRSTFSDWAAETTSFPSAVVESSLAHGDPDKVRAAYTRTQFVEKRRALMQAWGDFTYGN